MIKLHQAYAAIYDNDTVRMASSSGGIFTLIAQSVLEKGGVVFGAAITEQMQVAHICVERSEDLAALRGSKYVRSQLGNTYAQAKEILETGRPVLFTGTPCQIAGLRQYLQKDYENLLCQDLICHGAPMAKIWSTYLRFRENQAGTRAVSVNFRDKRSGWNNYSFTITFDNGTEYTQVFNKDPYMLSFLGDLSLGSACYQCKHKGMERQADITLADFWGAQCLMPQMFDDKGTSLLFVSSEKGKALLEQLQPQLTLLETDTEKAVAWNTAMIRSAAMPKNRDRFLQEVNDENFETLATQLYPRPTLLQRLTAKAKRIVKKILKL